MTRRHIFTGSPWEAKAGYARAVVLTDAGGDWVMVSGCTGFDYVSMTIADDTVAQAEQAMRNVEAALKEAGAGLDDVVRVTYVFTDDEDFERAAPVFGRAFERARPAAMAIVAGLIDPRMKIEIEVTARLAPDAP